jgi:NADH:ubiquinone oxidoreductase subunit 3 (subunit A)
MEIQFSSGHYYYLEKMDEYSSGMEPETKAFLMKVVNSFFVGAIWLLSLSTLGLFFGMAFIYRKIQWYNVVFYVFFLLSFLWIIRYYYRKWAGDFQKH